MTDEDNEVLRGISARIESAINILAKGDTLSALAILNKMLKVLPKAAQRNLDAAHG